MVGFRTLTLIVLLLLAALGVLALWVPFGVDQAIFVYGGRIVVNEGALYQDFWDIKPPGIFLFYALAGALAGFDEPGIHTLELFWQLALAALLLRVAWSVVDCKPIAAIAPVLTLGCYWIWGQAAHLTQIEALVGLPITGALLLANGIRQRPDSRFLRVLYGALTGVLLAFKPIYLLFPMSFAVLTSMPAGTDLRAHAGTRPRADWRSLITTLGWASAGIALIWIPLSIYFISEGTLGEMLRTTFLYPREAIREIPPAPTNRLWSSVAWCARVFASSLPLLLAGVLSVIRTGRRSVLAVGSALYLLVGIAAIVMQDTSWWEYHFVLLFPPLGLLAALGADSILELGAPAGRWRSARLAILVILLALPTIDLAAGVKHRWSALQAARALPSDAPLPVRLDPEYLRIWEKTRFLRETKVGRGGSIYVFGDFRMLLLSGRRQAIAVRGHAWQHLPNRFWRTLPAELMAAEPAFFFVGGYYRKMLIERSPELWQYIVDNYRRVRSYRSGHWYKRRRAPPE